MIADSMADFAMGGLGASFAGNAQTTDQNVVEWKSVLMRYGGMEDDTAETIAMKLAENDFPVPMPELSSVFTHEFLKELGVDRAGERVRVMLAVSLCPAVSKISDEMDSRDANSAATATLAVSKPAGFQENTDLVQEIVIKPANLAFGWIDLVGKDPPQVEYQQRLHELKNRFAEKRAKSIGQVENDARTSASESYTDGGTTEASSLDGVGREVTSGRKKAYELHEPFDVFEAPRPLPVFLVSPYDERFSSFVLRVPTPEVDFTEATIASLTNKWIVVVDSACNLVATVHRVDSSALCRLRNPSHRAMLDTMTHRQLLVTIFLAYINDFNGVIDESMEILDECEVKLLDKTAAHLVQLQRRASVYDRLIGLNQSLIRRVALHYSCRDAGDLESHWMALRERTSGMESRSNTLLGLVLALSGQRTTDVMTVLTKFSMCVSPLTLITGIYGMNFDNMPELHYEYSYYIVLAGFVIIVVGMLSWMKFIGL